MVNLKQRSFLTLKDYSQEEIRYLLDLAHKLKKSKKEGRIGKTLEGKNIVLLFEKTSTRTRCAFEVAALDEGAHVTFLSNSQMEQHLKMLLVIKQILQNMVGDVLFVDLF